jgi:cobalt-zinc-cadmium efflux system protein
MSRAHRLVAVLVLNLGLVAALVAAAVTAHSLAVLAEGGDYLLDAAGVGVTLLALRLARPGRMSGRPNATNVAALINSGWLLVLELLVAGAAAYRLVTGTPRVDGLPVLIVSGIAALAMTAGALILRGDSDGGGEDATRVPDLSITAVLLDTIADAAAAAGVAVAGAIILVVKGSYWLDPAVALAIAAIVAWHALALIHRILK